MNLFWTSGVPNLALAAAVKGDGRLPERVKGVHLDAGRRQVLGEVISNTKQGVYQQQLPQLPPLRQGLADDQDKVTYVEVDPHHAAIMVHLREAECDKRPNPQYLELVQQEVNPKMRAILVDWLVEVAEEYRLCADTLFCAVNFLDRFLSRQGTARKQLQLVGVTCMWLAAKYEEIYAPQCQDFIYICDNTYRRDQLLAMEEHILKTLEYQLTVPTAKTFLRRLLQVCSPDETLHYLSNYLTELSLLDYSMVGFLPSVVAASGLYLANLVLKRRAWDRTLRHFSGYHESDLSQCAVALAAVHMAVGTSQHLGAIREKYGHARFQAVSSLPPVNPTCSFV